MSIDRIGILVAVYPMVWGSRQLGTGWARDILGRKPLIVLGMALQGVAISITAGLDSFGVWIGAMALLGLGTALVYPTLLAAVGGAPLAGAVADLFGFRPAIQLLAAITVGSAFVALLTLKGRDRTPT